MRYSLVFLCLLWATSAIATIEVAFFENMDSKGGLVKLESNGRFAHIAISYQGGWLHSQPGRGVHIVDALSSIGTVWTILVAQNIPDLSEDQIRQFVGKDYDFRFDWTDNERFYCSELVAKILNLSPTEMRFEGSFWREHPDLICQNGELGASPDDVYERLLENNFTSTGQCSQLFGHL